MRATSWGSVLSVALGCCAAGAHGQCANDCGPGVSVEGEPCIVDLGIDATNGGCNSTPPVFTAATCGTVFCGICSTYQTDSDGDGVPDSDTRDTDWYLLSPAELAAADADANGVVQVRASVNSEFDGVVFIIALGDPVCVPGATVIGAIGYSEQGCMPGPAALATIALADHPSGIAVFVSTGDINGGGIFSGFACSTGLNDYTLRIDCLEPPSACAPGAGDCTIPNGTPGCEDLECCKLVCADDTFCCDVEWDANCVALAFGPGGLCEAPPPPTDLMSADGTWVAQIDAFGQIENMFPPDQPALDNVFETIVYEASTASGGLSRRVETDYIVTEGPTIDADQTHSFTRLQTPDGTMSVEIENFMIDGAQGGVLAKIRCENKSVDPVDCKLFYYCDYDISNDFGDDEASIILDGGGNFLAIEQIDFDPPGKPKPLWFGGCAPYKSWEVDTFATLRNNLDAGLAQLGNVDNTTPGAADHTAAISSESVTLQPGEFVEMEAAIGGVMFNGCMNAPPCPWDIDGDGSVGITDLLQLLSRWGPNPGNPADFDNDGVVGITDLLKLLANWGPC